MTPNDLLQKETGGKSWNFLPLRLLLFHVPLLSPCFSVGLLNDKKRNAWLDYFILFPIKDHWRLKYTEVQSQQMAFTRSPSLSNNPKILNNYLILQYSSSHMTSHNSPSMWFFMANLGAIWLCWYLYKVGGWKIWQLRMRNDAPLWVHETTKHLDIPDIRQFWYTTALFRPEKSTPKGAWIRNKLG